MNLFLRYSLDHSRRIKTVLDIDGKILQMNITVTALEEDGFCLVSAKWKTPRKLSYDCLLGASYARGDYGET